MNRVIKVRKKLLGSMGWVWTVDQPGTIQDYMMPTWESAMWLACDIARWESESRCGAM